MQSKPHYIISSQPSDWQNFKNLTAHSVDEAAWQESLFCTAGMQNDTPPPERKVTMSRILQLHVAFDPAALLLGIYTETFNNMKIYMCKFMHSINMYICKI